MYAKDRPRRFWVLERPVATLSYPFIGVPGVVASEIDVLPTERRDMLEQVWIELPRLFHLVCRAVEIDGIPQGVNGTEQVG